MPWSNCYFGGNLCREKAERKKNLSSSSQWLSPSVITQAIVFLYQKDQIHTSKQNNLQNSYYFKTQLLTCILHIQTQTRCICWYSFADDNIGPYCGISARGGLYALMKWIDQATLWKYVMPVTPDQNYMQIRAPHWKIIIMIARLDKKATHKGIVEHYFVCGVSFFLFLRLWQRDCAVKGRKKHRDWPFIFMKHILLFYVL